MFSASLTLVLLFNVQNFEDDEKADENTAKDILEVEEIDDNVKDQTDEEKEATYYR